MVCCGDGIGNFIWRGKIYDFRHVDDKCKEGRDLKILGLAELEREFVMLW